MYTILHNYLLLEPYIKKKKKKKKQIRNYQKEGIWKQHAKQRVLPVKPLKLQLLLMLMALSWQLYIDGTINYHLPGKSLDNEWNHTAQPHI